MLGPSLCMKKIESTPGVSLGTDLYFYSSLVWRARH